MVPKKPNRNFVSTLQLILAPKLRLLESERAPDVVVGEITSQMRGLLHQVKTGRQMVERAEKALEKLHVSVGHSCGCATPELSVDYKRKRDLDAAWSNKQRTRIEKFNRIKARAMVDLLDMDPKAAQSYLRDVRVEVESL